MVARSAEEWQRLVAEWRASGQPRREFAAARGVHPGTLSWWAWRLTSRDARRPRRSPGFAEVVVVEPASYPELVVEVGDVRVRVPRGFDAGELRRLVDALCCRWLLRSACTWRWSRSTSTCARRSLRDRAQSPGRRATHGRVGVLQPKTDGSENPLVRPWRVRGSAQKACPGPISHPAGDRPEGPPDERGVGGAPGGDRPDPRASPRPVESRNDIGQRLVKN